MKLTPLFCTALLALTLGGLSSVSAQEAPGKAPAGKDQRQKMALDFLTPEEKAQYEKARKKAMDSDPSIKADMESMKKDREAAKAAGTKPTPEERKAMRDKMQALQKKLDDAMVKADPTVQPIVDKVNAHRKEMMDKMGGRKKGGDAPAKTSSSQ